MTIRPELSAARTQLDECERIVDRLHALCCEPDRSPRMQAILSEIDAVRRLLDRFEGPDTAQELTPMIERIGGQIGHLQVACCTDARMPLYKDALNSLTAAQIQITASTGRGH